MLRLVAVCLLVAAGCGDDAARGPADAGADAAPPDGVLSDPSDVVFPGDRVLDVRITLAPADWEALRNQQPGPPELTCAGAGPTSYTYFPATITVDGTTVANVGLRKKGSLGSLSTTRPGLKVKANEYVSGQKIAGLKQLTLNNNHQDETLVSQCLGYELFAKAGVPSPRCAFAHVTVNGTDLGVYSNVETIRDQFLARHFADDGGKLYESGGDFAPGAVDGFQPKDDAVPPDCSDLDAIASAAVSDPSQIDARVGALVDLDAFSRYWAMEVVTSHWDGYANNRNNYFAYHDPTSGKLYFLPWGIDALFTTRPRTTRPQSVYACGSLAWHLYNAPATRARYLAALRDVLEHVWDASAIVAEIDRMQRLLEPFADPSHTGDFAKRLDAVRAFVQGREAVLRGELAGGDPVWPYAADQSCLIGIGTLDASFATTWGTLGTFGVGSGTMSGVIGGTNAGTSTVYASAGLDSDGKAMMQLFGQLGDGRYAVAYLSVGDPANMHPGSLAIDVRSVFAYMTFYDPVTDTATGGGLMLPGTITLEKASTAAGAEVQGTVSGTIIEL